MGDYQDGVMEDMPDHEERASKSLDFSSDCEESPGPEDGAVEDMLDHEERASKSFDFSSDFEESPGLEAKEAAAATKIQALKRGNDARQEVKDKAKKEAAAATKIQALKRGNDARQEVKDKALANALAQREVEESKAEAEVQAARKIQRFHRLRLLHKVIEAERKEREEEAARKIQVKYRKSQIQAELQRLQKQPVAVQRLSSEVVKELRLLVRKRPYGRDARPPDEDQRIYDILWHLKAFRDILEPLSPRARLSVIRNLKPRQLHARHVLVGSIAGEESMNAAGLVLTAEACLYLINHKDDQRLVAQRLLLGTAVTADMTDDSRISEECRKTCSLQVSCKQTIEVLCLSADIIQVAVDQEANREALRSAARDALRASEPWHRETQDLRHIASYLTSSVECFAGVADSGIERICQQASLMKVGAGNYLCKSGDEADGLRIMLFGSATESLPCLPALGKWSTDDLCKKEVQATAATFGDNIRTIFEDDACGEWELCFLRDDRRMTDVVSDCDCEMLFISRALYTRYMHPARCTKVLRQACLASLTYGSTAALKAERFDFPEMSQLCQASAGSAPVWISAESAAAIDCMLGYHDETIVPMLRSFPRNLRRQFCARGKLRRALRGEVIFEEGEPGSMLYVLVRGEVGLFQRRDETDPDFQDQVAELSQQLRRKGSRSVDELFAMGATSSRASPPVSPDDSPRQFTLSSVMSDLAMALFDVAARQYQKLYPPRVSILPTASATRKFIRDDEAEMLLVGKKVTFHRGSVHPRQGTAASESEFVNVGQMGLCTEVVEEGQTLGIASPGVAGGGPPRSHTAVALSATTDLFVFDYEALSEVLNAERECIPRGELASTILGSRECHERTPEDLLVLDNLIRGHEAFMNLESRTRAEICQKMHLVTVPKGQPVCRQGDEAIGFFKVLRGNASLHVRPERNFHHSLFKEEDMDSDPYEDGPMLMCLGEGGTFGEQTLLGKEEFQSQTIWAMEDLELAWVESFDYYDVTQRDARLGEMTLRRRALDALRKPVVEGRNDGCAEAIIQAVKHVDWIQQLDPAVRLEVARQASLLHVPLGEYLPHDERYMISVVLSGCVGRYPVEAAYSQTGDGDENSETGEQSEGRNGLGDESLSRPDPQLSCRASPAPSGVTALTSRSRTCKFAKNVRPQQDDTEEYLLWHRELQELSALRQELIARIGCEPLQASLQDRLHLHAVRDKLQKLEERISKVPQTTVLKACMQPGKVIKSSNVSPTQSMEVSNSVTTLGKASLAAADTQLLDSVAVPNSLVESSWLDSGLSIDRDDAPQRAFDLTEIEAGADSVWEVPALSPGILDVSGCEVEFREGDEVGGWTDTEQCPDQFMAHIATNILVVTRAAYENAMELVQRRSAWNRSEFLRLHLPKEATSDVIEKLAPIFQEESKQKRSVLVREGSISTTVWMIVEGTCKCTMTQDPSVLSCNAYGWEEEDALKPSASESKPSAKNRSELIADTAYKRRQDIEDIGTDASQRRPAGGLSCRGDRRSAHGADAASTPEAKMVASLTASASRGLPNGASAGRCTSARGIAVGGSGHAPVTVGLLKQGKLIGLFSALLHKPEPLTVTVSSAHAKLLAIPGKALVPNIPTPLFDVLKCVLHGQSDWHSLQSTRLAALPDQVCERLDSVRCQVQQQHVPRMIDSPFLRRHGTFGLEMLNNVVDRYGRLIHPESEWLFSSRMPSFFRSVTLSNLDKGHPEAAFYEYPPKPVGERAMANFRFRSFKTLSTSIQEESGDNEYLAADSVSELVQLSPQGVSQLSLTANGLQQKRTGADIHVPDIDIDSAVRLPPSEFEQKLREVNDSRIELMVSSRIQRETDASHKPKVTRIAPAPKPPQSHRRELPTSLQVYKSQAMRDRMVQKSPNSRHLLQNAKEEGSLPQIAYSSSSRSTSMSSFSQDASAAPGSQADRQEFSTSAGLGPHQSSASPRRATLRRANTITEQLDEDRRTKAEADKSLRITLGDNDLSPRSGARCRGQLHKKRIVKPSRRRLEPLMDGFAEVVR